MHRLKQALTFMVLAVGVAACGGTQGSVDSSQDATPSATEAKVRTGKNVTAHAKYLYHFTSVPEMAEQSDVIIGTVSAARDGRTSNPAENLRERRRILSVDVRHTLAGALGSNVDVETWGWRWIEGEWVEIHEAGVPWLEVGDKVLIGLTQFEEAGLRGASSAVSTYVFRDGRVAVPRDNRLAEPVQPLPRLLDGMTEAEVVEAFRTQQ
ncbi:MAG: hypothetical protein ACRDQ2_05760 [Gaiellales bacterium]